MPKCQFSTLKPFSLCFLATELEEARGYLVHNNNNNTGLYFQKQTNKKKERKKERKRWVTVGVTKFYTWFQNQQLKEELPIALLFRDDGSLFLFAIWNFLSKAIEISDFYRWYLIDWRLELGFSGSGRPHSSVS